MSTSLPVDRTLPLAVRIIVALGGFGGLAALIGLFVLKDRPATQPPPQTQPNINVTVNPVQNNYQNAVSAPTSTSASQQVTPANAQQHTASVQKPARPSLSDYEKYIDSNAHRVAGAMNVAIALRGLPGYPPNILEGAMHRALVERVDMNVVPLFREQFRQDGIERLFNGDASLANRLKLREHCESVLLGVLRFTGPAQQIGTDLYMREVVLEVRAVDPATGRVLKSLEIREKGGGASAELSSVNAISRLEQQVEANISEWSWV